jgi:hypothetical protein
MDRKLQIELHWGKERKPLPLQVDDGKSMKDLVLMVAQKLGEKPQQLKDYRFYWQNRPLTWHARLSDLPEKKEDVFLVLRPATPGTPAAEGGAAKPAASTPVPAAPPKKSPPAVDSPTPTKMSSPKITPAPAKNKSGTAPAAEEADVTLDQIDPRLSREIDVQSSAADLLAENPVHELVPEEEEAEVLELGEENLEVLPAEDVTTDLPALPDEVPVEENLEVEMEEVRTDTLEEIRKEQESAARPDDFLDAVLEEVLEESAEDEATEVMDVSDFPALEEVVEEAEDLVESVEEVEEVEERPEPPPPSAPSGAEQTHSMDTVHMLEDILAPQTEKPAEVQEPELDPWRFENATPPRGAARTGNGSATTSGRKKASKEEDEDDENEVLEMVSEEESSPRPTAPRSAPAKSGAAPTIDDLVIEEMEAPAAEDVEPLDEPLAEDEPEPQTIQRVRPSAPAASGPAIRRQPVVAFYRRMLPARVYPLTVTLEADKGAAATGADRPVLVRPVIPGCHVMPAEAELSSRPGSKARFWVTPLCRGQLPEAQVEYRTPERLIGQTALTMKVGRRRLARWLLLLTFVLPLLTAWLRGNTTGSLPYNVKDFSAWIEREAVIDPAATGVPSRKGDTLFDGFFQTLGSGMVKPLLLKVHELILTTPYFEFLLAGGLLVLTLLAGFLQGAKKATKKGPALQW